MIKKIIIISYFMCSMFAIYAKDENYSDITTIEICYYETINNETLQKGVICKLKYIEIYDYIKYKLLCIKKYDEKNKNFITDNSFIDILKSTHDNCSFGEIIRGKLKKGWRDKEKGFHRFPVYIRDVNNEFYEMDLSNVVYNDDIVE